MMTWARSTRGVFVLGVLALGCGAEPGSAGETSPPENRPLVIEGTLTPDELGYSINRFERNAALGVAVQVGGKTYQGCSGTLVGDRVVVTAAHCVVMNQEEWIYQGAEPEVASPAQVAFAVGSDVQKPLWLAKAESVHLHPDAEPQMAQQRIVHDMAVVILAASVWDNCTEVVPVQINLEALDDSFVGQELLQGGFGSLDGTYDFSPERYWSLVEVSAVDDVHVTVQDIGKGFPTYGDSGSGLFHRFDDGSLRNVGIASSGSSGTMRFTRLDLQTKLLDAVVTPELVCGPVDAKGVCRDDVSVRCDEHGMSSVDCRAKSQTCGVGTDGTTACQCACDADETCDPSCACDVQCPCTCDVTAGCDEGCACDAACKAVPQTEDGGEAESGCSVEAWTGGSPGSLAAHVLALLAALGCRRRARSPRPVQNA